MAKSAILSQIHPWLHKLLQIGVVSLLIAIPLYPKFPLIEVPGTYVAIRLEDFLIALVTGLWLLTFRLKILKLVNTPVGKAIVIFLAIGLLSLASALLITQTVNPLLGLLHTLRRIEYSLVFFITLSTIRDKQDIIFYVRVILLTLLFIFLYGIGQQYYSFPVISTMNREYSRGIAQEIMFGGRINSTFAGHYDLAAYSVIMLNVLFGVFVGLKHGWSKFFTWLGILAAFWLLVASASRISVLAYFSSITLTLWFLKRKLWIVPVLAVSLIFSSFAPGLVSRSMDTLKLEFAPRLAAIKLPEFNYLDRFHPQPTVTPLPTPTPKPTAAPTPDARPASSGSQPVPTPTPTQVVVVASTDETAQQVVTEDRSTAIRFNAEWPRALRAFYKNPLLGTGYSSITLATDNDYLRQLGEIGLLGLGAFILIFLHLYQKSWPIIKKGPKDFWTALIIGIAGGILGLQANALFIDVFAASKIAIYFWLLAGIMMGTINLITINRNS